MNSEFDGIAGVDPLRSAAELWGEQKPRPKVKPEPRGTRGTLAWWAIDDHPSMVLTCFFNECFLCSDDRQKEGKWFSHQFKVLRTNADCMHTRYPRTDPVGANLNPLSWLDFSFLGKKKSVSLTVLSTPGFSAPNTYFLTNEPNRGQLDD